MAPERLKFPENEYLSLSPDISLNLRPSQALHSPDKQGALSLTPQFTLSFRQASASKVRLQTTFSLKLSGDSLQIPTLIPSLCFMVNATALSAPITCVPPYPRHGSCAYSLHLNSLRRGCYISLSGGVESLVDSPTVSQQQSQNSNPCSVRPEATLLATHQGQCVWGSISCY